MNWIGLCKGRNGRKEDDELRKVTGIWSRMESDLLLVVSTLQLGMKKKQRPEK